MSSMSIWSPVISKDAVVKPPPRQMLLEHTEKASVRVARCCCPVLNVHEVCIDPGT